MKEMELFNYSLQKNTDEKQRQALVSIFSGQAKEDGPLLYLLLHTNTF
jgi:hypothetical protein